MIKPTIHMNGTSKAALARGYDKASNALRDALEAMSAAGPNARDYYVQDPAAFTRAAEEHEARCAKVREALAEIDELLVHVVTGGQS
jgi:hypothetical protein